MWRPLVIVAIAGLFMVSGVASAAPGDEVRIPVVLDEEVAGITHVVERGEHLWKISAEHLQEVSPRTGVADYWRRVISLNTSRLRSGDPDLIYPGEMIALPGITEPG